MDPEYAKKVIDTLLLNDMSSDMKVSISMLEMFANDGIRYNGDITGTVGFAYEMLENHRFAMALLKLHAIDVVETLGWHNHRANDIGAIIGTRLELLSAGDLITLNDVLNGCNGDLECYGIPEEFWYVLLGIDEGDESVRREMVNYIKNANLDKSARLALYMKYPLMDINISRRSIRKYGFKSDITIKH